MRLLELSRCLRRRAAGIVLVAAVLGMAFDAASAWAQADPTAKIDPRYPDDEDSYGWLREGHVQIAARGNYYSETPTLCAVELVFSADYANTEALLRRQTNPVAVLKRLEMGYELFGDPRTSNDLHAFVRARFERVDTKAPLRVERIAFDPIYGGFRSTFGRPLTAHWVSEPLDAEGYGKVSTPVAKMDKLEMYDFNGGLAFYKALLAVTLPELGEDRVYILPRAAMLNLERPLKACTCAFQNPRLNDRSIMNCAAPLLAPKPFR